MRSIGNSLLLLVRTGQTQKAAELLYFPSGVLETQWDVVVVVVGVITGSGRRAPRSQLHHLHQILVENVMELRVSLLLLPPAVHVVVPGPEPH